MKKLVISLASLFFSVSLFAQETVNSAPAVATGVTDTGLKAIAAAIAISVAALGGAIGQGNTAAAALDGIARNPAATGKIFTPFIIGMALIESLVILSLLIAFTVK